MACKNCCSLLFLLSRVERRSLQSSVDLGDNDVGLLGDEDTIEEFTLILASYSADLLDLGAHLGESCEVNAVEDKFALDIGRVGDLGAALHVDDLVLLSTQEVLDSDGGAVLGDDNVDGEMSVDQSHFVAEALYGRTRRVSMPV